MRKPYSIPYILDVKILIVLPPNTRICSGCTSRDSIPRAAGGKYKRESPSSVLRPTPCPVGSTTMTKAKRKYESV